ncbi:MFS general substrate transporter [Cenococcum geophilum 1.58]|uniref:MFS general substrate transporter n=1 Tax=Cenococcum geophilum 1.58 TaxID=794803 RepID=UPI00358E127D|nr:MFS general substrate transporter [Cenococcum geophilum 1.58]
MRKLIVQDGVKLHPQPTSDPLDPLNWSTGRKNGVLSTAMALPAIYVHLYYHHHLPYFPEIQEQYGISAGEVNWTVAIPALGLTVGPLIWSSPSDIYGRRIIFITGTVIAFATIVGAIKVPNYGGPGPTVGLAIISDTFYEHRRGLKVGLWVLAIDMGLLVGLLIGGFLDLVNHFWISWLTAILFAAILIVEVFFLRETLCSRNRMLRLFPYADGIIASAADIEKTARRPSVTTEVALKRVEMFAFINYWWILSIITFIPSAYTQYSPQIQGLLFIGLTLGTLFSELFFSRSKVMRLWLTYPAATLSAIGLILWGVSIDRAYHWIVGQVAFSSFLPEYRRETAISISMVTFYAITLNLSAFTNPFFITPRVSSKGYTWAFAVKGIITFRFCVPALVCIHQFSPKSRAWAGLPGWANPEYDSI